MTNSNESGLFAPFVLRRVPEQAGCIGTAEAPPFARPVGEVTSHNIYRNVLPLPNQLWHAHTDPVTSVSHFGFGSVIMTTSQQPGQTWRCMAVSKVEDLSDAVHGAGMEAIQMSTGKVSGSLVFAESDGVAFSSGMIDGRVALRGPLSPDTLTIGAVLRLEGECRHWLEEVECGAVGVFHGGDDHDAFYAPGTLYATATLSMDQLEFEAAKDDLVLDKRVLGGTRVHGRPMSRRALNALKAAYDDIHIGLHPRRDAGQMLLRALIDHLGRPPYDHGRRIDANLHVKIVQRARAYILANLSEPIALDDITAAAFTSRRSLFRAFADVFDDTPQSYVRRLRLHRIRQGLAGDKERASTIAIIANQWGISELGRLAGWYRELFGELPSETMASAKRPHPLDWH